MYKIDIKARKQAVDYYLQHEGISLKDTAAKFNIHYLSLFKWVKQYQEEGNKAIFRTYIKPWNRFPRNRLPCQSLRKRTPTPL